MRQNLYKYNEILIHSNTLKNKTKNKDQNKYLYFENFASETPQ